MPHPFGRRPRSELAGIAAACVQEIARLACSAAAPAERTAAAAGATRAALVEAPSDLEELNRFYMERQWNDGLLMLPPTQERVARMLTGTRRPRDEVIATIAPRYGAATVERIAINAVMAGCRPEHLPVLIAAAKAASTKAFHLQAIQATTNPAAVGLMLNGPAARALGVNCAGNCLGPGAWANGVLGRALRLILHNVGGGLPGSMDRATHGQPAKWSLCFAENEQASPWDPLHVERGFGRETSTVTVVGALGTWNMNITAGHPDDIIAMIGDTMQYPASSDYIHGGAPWLILSPEHARTLDNAGLDKAAVKRRLWEASRMRAGRSRGGEFERMVGARAAELGEITPDTMVPISAQPDDITLVVAGGAGTHSVFVPVSAHTRSVTVAIEE